MDLVGTLTSKAELEGGSHILPLQISLDIHESERHEVRLCSPIEDKNSFADPKVVYPLGGEFAGHKLEPPAAQDQGPFFHACREPSPCFDFSCDNFGESWGKGPYDVCAICQERIQTPYKCYLGRPLCKWYVIGNGHFQGMFYTYPKAVRLIHKMTLNNHESFSWPDMVHEWLRWEVAHVGHKENVPCVEDDRFGHHMFHCECCDKVWCTNGVMPPCV